MKTPDIIYIEDNHNDIEFTLRVFNKSNYLYSIKIIKDGEEALEYIFAKGRYKDRDLNEKPKLVLLDLKLPKINGLEILQKIKSNKHTKSIPVVILSSSNEESDLINSYQYGANSYIVKPMDFISFSNIIKNLQEYWLNTNECI